MKSSYHEWWAFPKSILRGLCWDDHTSRVQSTIKKSLAFYSHLHKAEWSKNQNRDSLHSLIKTTESLNMQQMKYEIVFPSYETWIYWHLVNILTFASFAIFVIFRNIWATSRSNTLTLSQSKVRELSFSGFTYWMKKKKLIHTNSTPRSVRMHIPNRSPASKS